MALDRDPYEMKFRRRTCLPDARLEFAELRAGLGQTLAIQLVTAAFPPEAVDRVAAEDAVLSVEYVDSPLRPKAIEHGLTKG